MISAALDLAKPLLSTFFFPLFVLLFAQYTVSPSLLLSFFYGGVLSGPAAGKPMLNLTTYNIHLFTRPFIMACLQCALLLFPY